MTALVSHWAFGGGISFWRTESRRARQLVLSWIATVGNYDYGFNWIFHQDGTLEMDVVLTGIMQTKGVTGAGDHHSHLVMKDVAATHHQHFFNFRLDMDVDGAQGNTVSELNTEGVPPGPAVGSGRPDGAEAECSGGRGTAAGPAA